MDLWVHGEVKDPWEYGVVKDPWEYAEAGALLEHAVLRVPWIPVVFRHDPFAAGHGKV
jgi:hypothetical protein